MSQALSLLVPLGLTVGTSGVRRMLGFADPKPGEEVLAPRPAVPVPKPDDDDDDDKEGEETGTAAGGRDARGPTIASRTVPRTAGVSPAPASDAITDAIAALLDGDGWRPVAEPLVDPVRALMDQRQTLEQLRDRLPGLLAADPDPKLWETLARLLGNARLAGLAGGALEPDGAPEPGRARRG